MTIRAKFKVVAITQHTDYSAVTIKLAPRYDEKIPEDQRYASATPSGELSMLVDNPAAIEELRLGQSFYLDLTPIPA